LNGVAYRDEAGARIEYAAHGSSRYLRRFEKLVW